MRLTPGTVRPERGPAMAAGARVAHALAERTMLAKMALVVTGVGVLAASAWISVPFYPVPMTMQTLAVLLVGGLLGPRLGAAAVAGYLALGLTGAPVFHNGLGGLAVIAGPTGGYLLGFVPAAFLMGLAAQKSSASSNGRPGLLLRLALLASGAVLAEMAIYALGVPWLGLYVGLDPQTAMATGLVPFLLGDLVKMTVAVAAVHGGRNLLARWGSPTF